MGLLNKLKGFVVSIEDDKKETYLKEFNSVSGTIKTTDRKEQAKRFESREEADFQGKQVKGTLGGLFSYIFGTKSLEDE